MGIPKSVYDIALTYPRCLKFSNFVRYMMAPTFCYQLEYPTDDNINYIGIIKYFVHILICLFLEVYLIFQHLIPTAADSVKYFDNRDYFGIFLSTLGMAIPGSYVWLVFFYAGFHAFTNLAAEITLFGDRRFYSDWWNAGNLGEYWRKWNHPIQNWLVRHVYFPLKRRGFKNDSARLITFTVSAVFHEYIAIGTFRVFNMIAFAFMMVNIPVMHFQSLFHSNASRNLNNITFWIGYTIIG